MSWSLTPVDPIHALVLMETAYPLLSHEVPPPESAPHAYPAGYPPGRRGTEDAGVAWCKYRRADLKCLNSVNLDQTHLPVLYGLVRKMLADIDVLGPLAPPDHMVPPLDARRVVLVYWRVWLLPETHVLEKVPQVDDLDCHLRCCIVFRFRRRQRHGLLHPTPLDNAVVELCQEPVVDLRETLFPQSESAKPSSPSEPPFWYVSLRLGFFSR
jgi:hypothetical protein